MPAKHTTRRDAAEAQLWDRLYLELIVDCVRRQGYRKALGCLHLASDLANQALIERRRQKGSQP